MADACPVCGKLPQVSECGCEVCATTATVCTADLRPDRCMCFVDGWLDREPVRDGEHHLYVEPWMPVLDAPDLPDDAAPEHCLH